MEFICDTYVGGAGINESENATHDGGNDDLGYIRNTNQHCAQTVNGRRMLIQQIFVPQRQFSIRNGFGNLDMR